MRKRFIFLLSLTAASFTITTSLFWIFESGRNPAVRDFFDVAWWWVVTSATVGYGDIVPITRAGRIVGIAAIISGFLAFANLLALMAESAHNHLERRSRGNVKVKCRNHIVLCEYTAVTDELIQSLPACKKMAGLEVVIVSDLVSQNPYPQHHFVNGVPINPAMLQRANVAAAKYVFIFANLRFADPDVKTLHVASRVLKLNPSATVFVEWVNPGSDLLAYAPPGLLFMDSRELVKRILSNRTIDPMEWLPKA